MGRKSGSEERRRNNRDKDGEGEKAEKKSGRRQWNRKAEKWG